MRDSVEVFEHHREPTYRAKKNAFLTLDSRICSIARQTWKWSLSRSK